ncbi:MAG TPA: RimK family protein [Casimicrobiaceae bacterium]|nr:RimK family protein [Casimicrobiaceae bacterium]
MNTVFVVNQLREWPLDIPEATVVAARTYLADTANDGSSGPARVFNLCRTNRYQGRGYYVSLVAEARGQQPYPDVKTIEDLQSGNLVHFLDERDTHWALPAGGASPLHLDAFFGRDPEERHHAACAQLFERMRAPLVRASFERHNGVWRLARAQLLSAARLNAEERAFAMESAKLELTPRPTRVGGATDHALAILHNPGEKDRPSNQRALRMFVDMARNMGIRAEILGRHDIERLPQFDGLFIRDTTHLNHYTYQFARRAAAEGLVVIDDPDSILKCNNKVYLNELLTRHHIPVPRTMLVQRDNVDEVVPTLGLPLIVKRPDSAFSLGVAKVESRAALDSVLGTFFASSDIVVAQEWVPTEFDWRVGVLDRRPLFVCQYLMAPGHWQVVKREPGRRLEGATVALSVGEAPEVVVNTAVAAANLIGDGLYGVDLKQVGDRCYVIEINDNPNIDAGNEDGVLKDALYREVLGVFLRRMKARDRIRSVAA